MHVFGNGTVLRALTAIIVFCLGVAAGVSARSAWYARDLTQREARDLVFTVQEAYKLFAKSSAMRPQYGHRELNAYAQTLVHRVGVVFTAGKWGNADLRFLDGHFLVIRGRPAGLMVFTHGDKKICLLAMKSELPSRANRLTVNGELPVEVRSGMRYTLALVGPASPEDKKLLFDSITVANDTRAKAN